MCPHEQIKSFSSIFEVFNRITFKYFFDCWLGLSERSCGRIARPEMPEIHPVTTFQRSRLLLLRVSGSWLTRNTQRFMFCIRKLVPHDVAYVYGPSQHNIQAPLTLRRCAFLVPAAAPSIKSMKATSATDTFPVDMRTSYVEIAQGRRYGTHLCAIKLKQQAARNDEMMTRKGCLARCDSRLLAAFHLSQDHEET